MNVKINADVSITELFNTKYKYDENLTDEFDLDMTSRWGVLKKILKDRTWRALLFGKNCRKIGVNTSRPESKK